MGVVNEKVKNLPLKRKFGSEIDVASLTGLSVKVLQKRRQLGMEPRFYKFGARVLYDLAEVEAFIQFWLEEDYKMPGRFRAVDVEHVNS